MKSTHTLVVAAIEGTFISGLTGIIDMLALATFGAAEYSRHSQTDVMSWTPRIITASRDGLPVKDQRGQQFNVDMAFEDVVGSCDAILIPGISPGMTSRLPDTFSNRKTQQWLRDQHAMGALVCSACSGAFVLGEAGLLDARRCTTTWWLHHELKHRFPNADVVWGERLLDSDRVVTAGGPLSWTDITIQVIRWLAGAKLAMLAADFAVVDTLPRLQNIYVPQNYLAATDPFLRSVEERVRDEVGQYLSVQALATSMCVSERTLHRRLKQLTGESPKTFIDRLRVNHACSLLQDADESVSNIADVAGFSEDTTFRRLFRRYTGMTPTDYRRWFIERAEGIRKVDELDKPQPPS